MPRWLIGCSGFHYKEWKGVFYPEKLPQTKWFEYYCQHFNTLELNVTFYRFPRPETLQNWYKKSPDGFLFSVKAPKLITHFKNFNDCERLLVDFYAAIQTGLEEKLGAVLFQLPARIVYSDELLQRIIDNLNPSFNNVIEFRDESWWMKKVFDTLKKHKISFCGISHPKLPDKVIKNNNIIYYRFHGVPVLYKSEYEKDFIERIVNEVKSFNNVTDAYIYFNNTWGTGALNNSKQIKDYISGKFSDIT